MGGRRALPAALLCLLGGCGMPRTGPESSGYFTPVGEPYAILGEAPHYALTLALNRPVNGDQPWFALVDYENPGNPTAHLIAEEEVPAGKMRVAFAPPALPRLHNNAKYAIRVRAFADADLKHPITTQVVTFTVAIFDPISSLRLSEGRPRTIGHPTVSN